MAKHRDEPDVALFVMQGCPACEEFYPRVQGVWAGKYRWAGVRVGIVDVNENPELADAEGIQATPTLVVVGTKHRLEGAVDDAEVVQLFERALQGV